MTRASGAIVIGFCLVLPLQVLQAHAADKCWTSSDYVDLYFRQFNGQVPLPHLRSPEQKALFEQLIDPCNLNRILEQPVSNDEKLRHLRIILASLGSFRAAYEVAVMVGEPLQQELAAVQAYSLSAADTEAGLDSQDGKAAWATLVAGVLDSISDTGRYTPSQAMLMADAITKHYPVISTALSAQDRERLRAKVQNVVPKTDNAGLLQAIARMKEVVANLP